MEFAAMEREDEASRRRREAETIAERDREWNERWDMLREDEWEGAREEEAVAERVAQREMEREWVETGIWRGRLEEED